MTVLFTCSQCGQTFNPDDEGAQACPTPISMAAAEHLTKVEAERDELLDVARQLRDYIINNHANSFASSPRVTNLLGEP